MHIDAPWGDLWRRTTILPCDNLIRVDLKANICLAESWEQIFMHYDQFLSLFFKKNITWPLKRRWNQILLSIYIQIFFGRRLIKKFLFNFVLLVWPEHRPSGDDAYCGRYRGHRHESIYLVRHRPAPKCQADNPLVFEPRFYLAKYVDLQCDYIKPGYDTYARASNHWCRYGVREGRQGWEA